MRQNAGEKKNRVGRAACALLIMVLLSTQLVCGIYARFTLEGAGGGSARAAAFVFVTQGAEGIKLDLGGIQKPGDSQSYTFTVSNQNGSAVSEVAQEVLFTVRLNGSMPLKCTISGGKGAAEVLSVNLAEDTQPLPVERTASAEVLPAAKGETSTYTMTVEWPETENDIKYVSRSAVAEVQLTVTAEQVD